MREIVLDTETTGLDPASGHRLIEIGCIEIVNLVPTGEQYWVYLNPEREIPEDATRIHGITDDKVRDKPKFAEEVDNFLAFIGDSPLVIHNAAFDMKFINSELARIDRAPLPMSRSIDTVMMARRKFPGQSASLDALCRRFGIDNSKREYHGAVIDAELLASVYLELKGGRQPNLAVEVQTSGQAITEIVRTARVPRALPGCGVNDDERAAHDAFIAKLKNPLWPAAIEAESDVETPDGEALSA